MCENIVVSVVLASRNRSAELEKTLTRFEAIETDGFQWEVIVSDNGSTDDTARVLQRASEKLPLVVQYQERPGKSAAVNLALDVARGDLVVFTDDDVGPCAGWLKAYVSAAKNRPDVEIFGGPTTPLFDVTPVPFLRAGMVSVAAYSAFELLSEFQALPYTIVPWGTNFCVRRNAIGNMRFSERFGPREGTSYPMGNETQFLRRLRSRGRRAFYVPDAAVSHTVHEHQLKKPWLSLRAVRNARGLLRSHIEEHFGKPMRLSGLTRLRLLALRGATKFLSLFSPSKASRIEHNWTTNTLIGFVDENRLMLQQFNVRQTQKRQCKSAAEILDNYIPSLLEDLHDSRFRFPLVCYIKLVGDKGGEWVINLRDCPSTCKRGTMPNDRDFSVEMDATDLETVLLSGDIELALGSLFRLGRVRYDMGPCFGDHFSMFCDLLSA